MVKYTKGGLTMIQEGEILNVLQDHEGRIARQEEFNKNLYTEMKELKAVINEGNRDASEKLDIINNKLLDEHLHLRRNTHETRNSLYLKIAGGFIGTGGVLYALYDIIIRW